MSTATSDQGALVPRVVPRLIGRAPRQARWLTAVAGVGTVGTAAGAVILLGFLIQGALAGPVDLGQLLTAGTWDPSRDVYGAAAMLFGTVAVAVIALGIATPLGWSAAIALTELVAPRRRRLLRSGVELLAAVPSIVYGLIGIALLRPLVAGAFDVPGGDSLLAAGLVLAVMVLPTVVAVSVDALSGVPAATREAAAALGLTRAEVVRSAVLPAARPGMRAAALLGLARALGETIAVFLVIGRADGRLPTPAGLLPALIRPGQTLTTKLGGPEPVLAGAVGSHRAALSILGLLLLGIVAAATVAGLARARGASGARRSTYSRAHRQRAAHDRLLAATRWAALIAPLLLVAGMAALLLSRGGAALSPSFWLDAAVGASGGGVRNQILGTVVLVAATAIISAPLGLGLGLVLAEYARPRVSRLLRTATVTLGGAPTILLGLAFYSLFSLTLGLGKSWLAGALALAVVVVPVAALTTAARIDSLAPQRREAALALGLSRAQVVRSVLLPHARPGLLTGLLLGLARAAGETAPLLFTATVFAGASAFPTGVARSPVVALPTHVFNLAQDAADQASLDAAWGAAVVLVILAGLLLVAAIPARRRLEQELL